MRDFARNLLDGDITKAQVEQKLDGMPLAPPRAGASLRLVNLTQGDSEKDRPGATHQ
jgi:hypothetical protein